MPSAPLRLIAGRSLEVFTHYRGFPKLFVVNEVLACGHVYVSHTWDFLDLVNAYTDNADVSARRRRCHSCARIMDATNQPAAAYSYVRTNEDTTA